MNYKSNRKFAAGYQTVMIVKACYFYAIHQEKGKINKFAMNFLQSICCWIKYRK